MQAVEAALVKQYTVLTAHLGRINLRPRSYHKGTAPEFTGRCTMAVSSKGSWCGHFGLHRSTIAVFTLARMNHTCS